MNLLADTSVFIAAAHYRPYQQLLDGAIRRGRLLLSSVVVMELYAGFKSQEARRSFTRLHRDLERAEKIVALQHKDFLLAGRVLFHLSQEAGQLSFKDHFRDGLIAVSAARIGATVVTENRRNFELWRNGLSRSGRRLSLHVVARD